LASHSTRFGGESKRVRLIVVANGAFEIRANPFSDDEFDRPRRVMLAKDPIDSTDVFLYHKTTYRRVYETAQNSCADSDDVLLWNERSELTESCIANLVLEIDKELFTPPIDCGLLPGTFRAWLLEQEKIKERVLKVSDLSVCSKIYLINSVRKWQTAELVFKPAV